jgi:hypothetical protein
MNVNNPLTVIRSPDENGTEYDYADDNGAVFQPLPRKLPALEAPTWTFPGIIARSRRTCPGNTRARIRTLQQAPAA